RASPAHKRAGAIIFCSAKRPVSSCGAFDWAVCGFSVELSQPTRKSVMAQIKNEQVLFIVLLLSLYIILDEVAQAPDANGATTRSKENYSSWLAGIPALRACSCKSSSLALASASACDLVSISDFRLRLSSAYLPESRSMVPASA